MRAFRTRLVALNLSLPCSTLAHVCHKKRCAAGTGGAAILAGQAAVSRTREPVFLTELCYHSVPLFFASLRVAHCLEKRRWKFGSRAGEHSVVHFLDAFAGLCGAACIR